MEYSSHLVTTKIFSVKGIIEENKLHQRGFTYERSLLWKTFVSMVSDRWGALRTLYIGARARTDTHTHIHLSLIHI